MDSCTDKKNSKRVAPGILLLATLFFVMSCRDSKTLFQNGLSYAHLGDVMIPAGMGHFKGHAVRDTICSENDYQWRAAVLKYPNGNVWIEEDFFGEGIVIQLVADESWR